LGTWVRVTTQGALAQDRSRLDGPFQPGYQPHQRCPRKGEDRNIREKARKEPLITPSEAAPRMRAGEK
jgi:hypothetical protein